jgi:hypothetical protein
MQHLYDPFRRAQLILQSEEEKVPMGFYIQMRRHTEPEDEWGTITLGGSQYWADPVLANRKFRGVLHFVRSNIRANWDLRLMRSGDVINTVYTSSHHRM